MTSTSCPQCGTHITMAQAPRIGSEIPREFVGKPGLPMIVQPCGHLVLIQP